jgi:hypothetical protein
VTDSAIIALGVVRVALCQRDLPFVAALELQKRAVPRRARIGWKTEADVGVEVHLDRRGQDEIDFVAPLPCDAICVNPLIAPLVYRSGA